MIQSTDGFILMRSGGPLVDIQFGGLRLPLMFSVTAYSWPTLLLTGWH